MHDFEAFAEFFDGLGNAIEGFGQGLDVLPFQGGDEHLHEFLADGFGVAFLVAPGHREFGERDIAVGFLQQARQGFDALVRGFCTGGEQFEEPVRISK